MLKLGSDTFAKNNFVSEKKLFLARYELHDNMKAWTDLLNNRTRRQNGQKKLNKKCQATSLEDATKRFSITCQILTIL